MTDGRTVWWPKDAAWWRREYIVALLEEFGADGPAVVDWLSCEAKSQNDGGQVKSGIRSVSRGCGVDLVTVGHVLSRAVTLGAIDDFEEADGRFVCRISGWATDNRRALAAERKAVQREKEAGLSRPVTLGHAPSQNVPLQDRTEEVEGVPPSTTPPSSELDTARIARDLFAYWQERCAHATSKPTADRLRKVQARLREGYTPDDIRKGIDGAARAAFVNEQGKRFDDLELICRSGSKLEGFIARATATPTAASEQHDESRRRSDALLRLTGGAA